MALAALKGDKTINELASQFGVHPTLIQDWKKHLLTTAEQVFANGVKADTTAQAEAQKAELFEQIGRLKMELEWLKKKSDHSAEQLRRLIDSDHPRLSVRRQCQMLGLNRSSLYYQPAGETEDNLRLMRLIDQEYTAHPFLCSRRLTKWLMERGEAVNRRLLATLDRFGLLAVDELGYLSFSRAGADLLQQLVRGDDGSGALTDHLREAGPRRGRRFQEVIALLMTVQQSLQPLAKGGIAGAALIQKSRSLGRIVLFQSFNKERLLVHRLAPLGCEVLVLPLHATFGRELRTQNQSRVRRVNGWCQIESRKHEIGKRMAEKDAQACWSCHFLFLFS